MIQIENTGFIFTILVLNLTITLPGMLLGPWSPSCGNVMRVPCFQPFFTVMVRILSRILDVKPSSFITCVTQCNEARCMQPQQLTFLQRDAMLAWYMLSSCVLLSVRLSHAGIVPKRLNLGSCKQLATINVPTKFKVYISAHYKDMKKRYIMRTFLWFGVVKVTQGH